MPCELSEHRQMLKEKREMGAKEEFGSFVGLEWQKWLNGFLALGFFETGKMHEKEGKSQIFPLYGGKRERSLAV